MTSQDSNVTTPKSNILVLGATGGTGRLIVRDALARGHHVTALVRSPDKAGDLQGAQLIVGDARDEATLRKALKGQDVVISSLGTSLSPFREVTTLSTSTRALVKAMEAENVARLVAITGIGAGDSRGHGGFVYDRVIVRPAMLNDKPGGQTVRALTDLTGFHGGTIARADVARFAVDQVSDDSFLRRSPLITW
ncbi:MULTISPECIES: NAD(P)-dependent oxidoreductase [unclassified Bradyrhizobium]|uniref:NAD(P)-dependent oxidoreductase n=1 Tax=unclassified Bradyrhizobium TaxID=2631580 RepID=UPI0028E4DE15|nr:MULTISPECIES: NAD(P)H-binding protein [unclassified Bradyrhizobium]